MKKEGDVMRRPISLLTMTIAVWAVPAWAANNSASTSAPAADTPLPSSASASQALPTGSMPVQPARCPICGRANNPTASYTEKASFTLVRGLSNTAFGWTELLMQPTDEVEHGGNVFVGMGKGLTSAAGRTVAGVGEIFTFWLPQDNKKNKSLIQTCPLCMRSLPPADK